MTRSSPRLLASSAALLLQLHACRETPSDRGSESGGGADQGGASGVSGADASMAGDSNASDSNGTSGASGTGDSPSTGGTGGASGGTSSVGGADTAGTHSGAAGARGTTLVAKTISAGEAHVCVVINDGTVRCWGSGGYGEVGDGTTAGSVVPVPVVGITNAVALAAGGYHTCARLIDGTIQCWGRNVSGQLGNGTTIRNGLAPVPVSGITDAVSVAAGAYHTCAVLADGTVKCWGNNNEGELGDGTAINSSEPVVVSGITNAKIVAAGYYHTCAILDGGTVKCWGDNNDGRLGDGTAVSDCALSDSYSCALTPVEVSGIKNATSLAASSNHTCAILSDGTVECWGDNGGGQISGDGTANTGYVPVAVSSLTDATAVAAGAGHSCAVLHTGTVQCWGSNSGGQLGNGTWTGSSEPVTVTGITNAIAVAAGSDSTFAYTCAVLGDGSVRCWGEGAYGCIGDGTLRRSSVPVTVSGF